METLLLEQIYNFFFSFKEMNGSAKMLMETKELK